MREFVDNHPAIVYLGIVGIVWIAGYLLFGTDDVNDAVGFLVVPAVLLLGLGAGLWKLWKGRKLDRWEAGVLGFVGMLAIGFLMLSIT
jgi:hypothetical protein